MTLEELEALTEVWDSENEKFVPSKNNRVAYNGFNLQKGDILVTNATSSAGVLGYAAVMNGSNHVLHMPGGLPDTFQSAYKPTLTNFGKAI